MMEDIKIIRNAQVVLENGIVYSNVEDYLKGL